MHKHNVFQDMRSSEHNDATQCRNVAAITFGYVDRVGSTSPMVFIKCVSVKMTHMKSCNCNKVPNTSELQSNPVRVQMKKIKISRQSRKRAAPVPWIAQDLGRQAVH